MSVRSVFRWGITSIFFLSSIFLIVGIGYSDILPVTEYNGQDDGQTETNLMKVKHLETPVNLKAVYMTSYVAGDKPLRTSVKKLADETEINSIVIDIKDYTGHIAFDVSVDLLKKFNSAIPRIPDIKDFLKELHDKDIYLIGRIAVFQDPLVAGKRKDLAVLSKTTGNVWKDYKGLSWIDPGAREYWEYILALALESYQIGFDEINFDYIRFPSDGNMKDISYPHSKDTKKTEVMKNFFSFMRDGLKDSGVVMSADLFGMTMTNTDDLNIGQSLESAIPYFDYISPMVYPSHYPTGFIGIKNPASKPYEVVRYSLDKASDRSSTTPQKIRPWLQDFNLGATYDAKKIRKQIQATYDAGFDSWMLWNAKSVYTRDALLPFWKEEDSQADTGQI
ncbi:MAG: hypothetical protein A3G59_00800 [Candidatus Taylorbacteria bacterium RIFCSPLOWO2_12_FULL_47_20]|uniref:DUF4015 domain-containing protein n=2 Tax=Candidatus Tayloriibacteriota TaxID=1817919 RepID=A0A1G2P4W4_9BACT|nr:MAG: hypothetical protein A3H68_00155 [Candidatus Taylorbacteria bacterium RIFCSPLOWO2_02_FULL_46_40]OHA43303.1 MAG: hypothetical protein A3G59_00800 [Candidatus Taylorbacteria bacterium RIFCSPLOWO2_12_FULL_47_20]